MKKENHDNYSPGQTLIRLLKFSRPYYSWYIGLAIVTIFSSGTSVLMAEAYRRMVNAATQGDFNLLHSGLLFAVILVLVTVIFGFISQYYGPVLDHISSRRFSLILLGKFSKIKIKDLKSFHSGQLIRRNDEAQEAQSNINNRTRSILHNLLRVIFLSIYLYNLNARLTIYLLLIAIIFPLLIIPLSRQLRSQYDKRFKAIAEKNTFLQDMAQGAEIVKTFTLAEKLEEKYKYLFEKMLSYIKKTTILETFFNYSNFIIVIAGALFVLYYGGILVLNGILDIGALVAFLVSFEQIVMPLAELFRTWPEFQKSISQANRVFEILDLSEETEIDSAESGFNQAGGSYFERVKPDSVKPDKSPELITQPYADFPVLEARNIYFAYKDYNVLKDISFSINTGEVIAFVGPSGSGKSTFLKLLLRFYEPSSGEFIYNGYSVDSIPLNQWRKRIAYVSQEPCLFSGTIYENIVQGRIGAGEAEVREAARLANIHDFIINTSDGYNSKVGERGIRLSGGERQRIAIARAILSNPEILILDEPTSSLDSENEKIVQQALDQLMQGRTTIVVAHRLSTIRDADKIIFLQNGVIEEFGNHDSLLEAKGKYYKMYFSDREVGI